MQQVSPLVLLQKASGLHAIPLMSITRDIEKRRLQKNKHSKEYYKAFASLDIQNLKYKNWIWLSNIDKLPFRSEIIKQQEKEKLPEVEQQLRVKFRWETWQRLQMAESTAYQYS